MNNANYRETASYKRKKTVGTQEIRDINNMEDNENISPATYNVWDCMNDKFAKKNLWWTLRYAKAQKRIKELEQKLGERSEELLQLGAVWDESAPLSKYNARLDRDNLIAAAHRLRRLLSAYTSPLWREWYNAVSTTAEERKRWYSHRVAPFDVLPMLPVEEKITMVILREVICEDGYNKTEVLVFDDIDYVFPMRDAEYGYSYGQQVKRHAYDMAQTLSHVITEFVQDKTPNVSLAKRNTVMFAQRVGGYPVLPDGFRWVPIKSLAFTIPQQDLLRQAARVMGLNYEDKKRKGANQR